MHWSFSPEFKLKTLAALLLLALALRPVCGQEHLEPWPKSLSSDQYYAKIREILADAYRGEVVLRIVIAPSFQPKEIAGIRHTANKGYEVFDVKPTTMIWNTLSPTRIRITSVACKRQRWQAIHTGNKSNCPEFEEGKRAFGIWTNKNAESCTSNTSRCRGESH